MNKEKFILIDENLTLNKFIGFEPVDGEYIWDYKDLFNKKFSNDFEEYRYVEKISDNVYKTYIFPTVKEYENNNVNAEIYITTLDDIISQLIRLNNSNCIYKFDFTINGNKIYLDDMLWHYIGCFSGGYKKDIKAINHDKFNEIINLTNQFSKKK